MKKLILLSVMLSVLLSCSSRRQMEKALYSGNYDQAITTALRKLRANKDAKRNYDLVVLLQDAYKKVTQRDLEQIAILKADANPENYKTIYGMYVNMDSRQEAIKPLLPLRINGREVAFNFNDYTQEILNIKQDLVIYEYQNAENMLSSNDKYILREAYRKLKYIDDIQPNYRNVRNLMEEAHFKGTDFVLVSIENQTNQIIPRRLEDDLLNFDTYGLNNFWTVYHAETANEIDYDFAMELQLRRINILPERIINNQHLRKKEIVDGWEYLLDDSGNVVQDSLGNDIKVDKVITVKARVFEILQSKESQIIGDVVYFDLKQNQRLKSFPISSGYIFENRFGTFRGDERALSDYDRDIINGRRMPFPSNEQMVYDTGEDLKLRLKDIINSYRF